MKNRVRAEGGATMLDKLFWRINARKTGNYFKIIEIGGKLFFVTIEPYISIDERIKQAREAGFLSEQDIRDFEDKSAIN